MRLLYGVSVSEDVETYVINKLRVVCGSECADKLQRMFTGTSMFLLYYIEVQSLNWCCVSFPKTWP